MNARMTIMTAMAIGGAQRASAQPRGLVLAPAGGGR
jgi:hypothetical protein